MLAESRNCLGHGNSVQRTLAEAIQAYFKAGGEDIDFPTSKQSLSLELATKEYKNNPNSPEALTQFMCSFWAEAGQKTGKTYTVDNFPLIAEEIKERTKKGQMAIFVPAEVRMVDLGKMFPEMGELAVQKVNSAVDTVGNSGWVWIEPFINAPNTDTTQEQLEDKFKKEGRQGQSLRSYIVGGQISKLLTGKYFDEGITWSRLLGSCDVGGVLSAGFNPDGSLDVDSVWGPDSHTEYMGGRSEEVIKD